MPCIYPINTLYIPLYTPYVYPCVHPIYIPLSTPYIYPIYALYITLCIPYIRSLTAQEASTAALVVPPLTK